MSLYWQVLGSLILIIAYVAVRVWIVRSRRASALPWWKEAIVFVFYGVVIGGAAQVVGVVLKSVD